MSKTFSAKELRSESSAIHAELKKLGGQRIHKHLVNLMKHTVANRDRGNHSGGDVSLSTHFLSLLRMIDKEGNSNSIVRTDAIKAWLELFGFCQWQSKGGKDGFKLRSKMLDGMSEQELAEHMRKAATTPWNKLVPEKPYNIFDFDKALASLLKRAKEKAEETGPNGEKNKVDMSSVSKIEELAVELGLA